MAKRPRPECNTRSEADILQRSRFTENRGKVNKAMQGEGRPAREVHQVQVAPEQPGQREPRQREREGLGHESPMSLGRPLGGRIPGRPSVLRSEGVEDP